MSTPFDIDRFLNIRSALGPSFAPDGRFVSFLTNITGIAQLWQVPVQGGWPVQLTFTRETVRAGHYNPRRPELIFAMDVGGNERTQLYRLHGLGAADHDLGDGWTSDDLTGTPRAVHAFGGWSHEGDAFAFSANRTDPSRFDVYVQKVGSGSSEGRGARLVHKGPGGYYRVHGWSPDDRWLLVSHDESSADQDLYVLDVENGKARHLTAHRGRARYESPHWSADGRSIYCASTAHERDLPGLARIEVASGKLTYIETPEHEVEEVLPSPRGRWLAWLVNAGGASQLRLTDLQSKRTRSAPGLPLGVVSSLAFAQDDGRLAFAFNGPRYNSDVWLWDLADGPGEGRAEKVRQLTAYMSAERTLASRRGEGPAERVRQLTHSARAGIPFSRLVEPELIHYKTFDGRMIPAWYYPPAVRPREGRLPPVIVYPHGGPESQTRAAFNPLFQYFVQRGYAVLAPNVRGSTGHGTAYMDLDNTTKRMDSVKDLAHAVYWLRDQKMGDPKRVAVYGGSYGGFMVLAAVTHYPDLWAAGIDVVGIANFVTFLEKTGPYRRAHREAEYGNLREHRAFLEQISPIHHVDKIKCPMMVIHGANDPRVPVGEAEQIVAALRKRGIPVEYLRYEDEGHGLAKLKNRLDAYPKMADFLDRYLK